MRTGAEGLREWARQVSEWLGHRKAVLVTFVIAVCVGGAVSHPGLRAWVSAMIQPSPYRIVDVDGKRELRVTPSGRVWYMEAGGAHSRRYAIAHVPDGFRLPRFEELVDLRNAMQEWAADGRCEPLAELGWPTDEPLLSSEYERVNGLAYSRCLRMGDGLETKVDETSSTAHVVWVSQG